MASQPGPSRAAGAGGGGAGGGARRRSGQQRGAGRPLVGWGGGGGSLGGSTVDSRDGGAAGVDDVAPLAQFDGDGAGGDGPGAGVVGDVVVPVHAPGGRAAGPVVFAGLEPVAA